MSDFVSRGFAGRRRVDPDLAARVPPGRYVAPGFPVLTAGPTPRVDPGEWALTVDGVVAAALRTAGAGTPGGSTQSSSRPRRRAR